jgi:hypothetical protein
MLTNPALSDRKEVMQKKNPNALNSIHYGKKPVFDRRAFVGSQPNFYRLKTILGVK